MDDSGDFGSVLLHFFSSAQRSEGAGHRRSIPYHSYVMALFYHTRRCLGKRVALPSRLADPDLTLVASGGGKRDGFPLFPIFGKGQVAGNHPGTPPNPRPLLLEKTDIHLSYAQAGSIAKGGGGTFVAGHGTPKAK